MGVGGGANPALLGQLVAKRGKTSTTELKALCLNAKRAPQGTNTEVLRSSEIEARPHPRTPPCVRVRLSSL